MKPQLKQWIYQLMINTQISPTDQESLFHLISEKYNTSNRYYHNLDHLEKMFSWLKKVKVSKKENQLIAWTIVWHDIIYDTNSDDNEIKSSLYFENTFRKITHNLTKNDIGSISKMILATKEHQINTIKTTNILLDLDLVILSSSTSEYENYTKNIRLEYHQYSDSTYYLGRKKVLEHFINMEYIYKSPFFIEQLEVDARYNLKNELLSIMKIIA